MKKITFIGGEKDGQTMEIFNSMEAIKVPANKESWDEIETETYRVLPLGDRFVAVRNCDSKLTVINRLIDNYKP